MASMTDRSSSKHLASGKPLIKKSASAIEHDEAANMAATRPPTKRVKQASSNPAPLPPSISASKTASETAKEQGAKDDPVPLLSFETVARTPGLHAELSGLLDEECERLVREASAGHDSEEIRDEYDAKQDELDGLFRGRDKLDKANRQLIEMGRREEQEQQDREDGGSVAAALVANRAVESDASEESGWVGTGRAGISAGINTTKAAMQTSKGYAKGFTTSSTKVANKYSLKGKNKADDSDEEESSSDYDFASQSMTRSTTKTTNKVTKKPVRPSAVATTTTFLAVTTTATTTAATTTNNDEDDPRVPHVNANGHITLSQVRDIRPIPLPSVAGVSATPSATPVERRKVRCPLCARELSTQNFRRHLATLHLDPAEWEKQCADCGKTFPTSDALGKHRC